MSGGTAAAEGGVLTARRLNRCTLARQLLLERADLTPDEAVVRLAGLQGQAPASPYLALWNRERNVRPADVDALFRDGTLVRATLMRLTLHVAHRADHPVFLQAMQPSVRARLDDERFRATGLTPAELDALVEDLLAHADEPHTAADLQEWLAAHLPSTGGPPARAADPAAVRGALWAVRLTAPLLRATSPEAPWSFATGRASYVASDARPAPDDTEASDEALGVLLRRYLAAFGPASVADAAQFLTVRRTRVRRVLTALEGAAVLRRRGPGEQVLYDVPDAELPGGDRPAPPRLLGMWDNVLLAYADRSRLVPPEYRRVITRTNGDQLPTVLVDGRAAGVWRAVEGGVEVTAFRPLRKADWAGLAEEARGLTAFLADREPLVYSRYGHWWPKLPPGEVRVLPGG